MVKIWDIRLKKNSSKREESGARDFSRTPCSNNHLQVDWQASNTLDRKGNLELDKKKRSRERTDEDGLFQGANGLTPKNENPGGKSQIYG